MSEQNDYQRSILNLNFFKPPIYNQFAVEWTEIVKFLKYVRKVIFFKQAGFFEKKLIFFFKIGKGGKFAVECVYWKILFLKNVFDFNCEVPLQKSENF